MRGPSALLEQCLKFTLLIVSIRVARADYSRSTLRFSSLWLRFVLDEVLASFFLSLVIFRMSGPWQKRKPPRGRPASNFLYFLPRELLFAILRNGRQECLIPDSQALSLLSSHPSLHLLNADLCLPTYCLRSSLIIVLQLSSSHRLHQSIFAKRSPNLRSRPRDVHRGRLMISRLSFPSSSKPHSLHSRLSLSSASLLFSFSSSLRVFLTNFLSDLRVRNGLAYSLGANRHTSARIKVDLQTELFRESCPFAVQSSEMFFTCSATMQST